MRIAILGATGHIGRCLALSYAQRHDVTLFARRPDAAADFIVRRGLRAAAAPLAHFAGERFDLVVNAVGYGEAGRILGAGEGVVEVTEAHDRLCLDSLLRYPDTHYVFLSSGAVYGPEYRDALVPSPTPRRPVDLNETGHFYRLAKYEAELRHRAARDLDIADVRIFGFASAELSLTSELLIAQILRALCLGERFVTHAEESPRDYVTGDDLAALIDLWCTRGAPNGEYDLLSAAPTSKLRVLAALERSFGLEYRLEGAGPVAPVPLPARLSLHASAAALGYVPRRSSLELILSIAKNLAGVPWGHCISAGEACA